jgi:hypothetical protein
LRLDDPRRENSECLLREVACLQRSRVFTARLMETNGLRPFLSRFRLLGPDLVSTLSYDAMHYLAVLVFGPSRTVACARQ